MTLIRFLATAVAAAAALVLLRRRPGRLRRGRARAALRPAARGGARYAASAPRLFAGEQRQLLREDLALITSELSGGARFAELAGWPQHERDLAAETIYRFVVRSLYDARAFNGDPHPGSYPFHRGGKVTFLDFGLVRHFTPAELQPLPAMARTTCVGHDPGAFRASVENAGFLRPGAPLSTPAIIDHLAVFSDTIREPGPVTITSDYASPVVRRFFDLRSPAAGYIAVPRPYVILQRINLGLPAVPGELSATADWRAIAEETWPFTHGPAATPMGQAEAAWRARRQATAA